MINTDTPAETCTWPPASGELASEIGRIWSLFSRGVADKRSPFNVPTVGTVASNDLPAIRTVVLRACAPSERMLAFHTDRRSRKPAEIAARTHIGWHVWAARQRLQVRLRSVATLHLGDPVAETAWANLHAGSKALYRQSTPPLTPLGSSHATADTAGLSDSLAFGNFVVVQAIVTQIEWLELDPAGHKRGLAGWDETSAQWLATWAAS